MHENIPPTPEEIEEYMRTPEGALELQRILEALENDSQMGAFPDIPGADIGLPLETIGASPDIPGATRGLPPDISGINPVEENRRRGTTLGASPNIPGATIGLPPRISGINPMEENRRRMMQQLMPGRGRGLGLGY
jgi:hypothetical protein